MLVSSISVENLLTYGTFECELDDKLTVFVGPNGSGKSNIVRVLDLVQKALDVADHGTRAEQFTQGARQSLRAFAAARHHGEPAERGAEVRLGVCFTTENERLLLLIYFRAAVLYALLEDLNPGDDALRSRVADWVESEISEGSIEALFVGTIVLKHRGLPQIPWDIGYEFTYDGARYLWVLIGATTRNIIVPIEGGGSRTLPTPQRLLAERFLGSINPGNRPIQLPDEYPPFEFGRLCAPPGEAAPAPTLHVGTSVFNRELAPFREAITLLGIPAEPQTQTPFPLGHILSTLMRNGVIIVGEQLRGLGTGSTPPLTPGPYPWDALASPGQSHAPWQLPLRLFTLKNGTMDEKRRYEAIRKMFAILAPGRSIDVLFQATTIGPVPLAAGQVALANPAPQQFDPQQLQPGAVISITVDRSDDTETHPPSLPIQLHGAGTWEALVLAEALAEADGRLVVLDEPAVTMHPSWQRALRSEIKRTKGQLLLITHSADLVPMEDGPDLERLVRIENETGRSRIHRFSAGDLTAAEVAQITRDFALSADAVSLLFARGVILVEGETELGLLPTWFTQAVQSTGDQSPGDLDLAFWSVGSDTHFRPYVTVLNALSIPWVIVCDGAVFDLEKRQKSQPHVFSQVLSAGFVAPELRAFLDGFNNGQRKRVMDATLFGEETALGRRFGIFTLAPGWKTRDKKAMTPGGLFIRGLRRLGQCSEIHSL